MVFLVVLFLFKNSLLFKNTVDFIQGNQASGLAYDANITLVDLVNKDTDGDGVLDWEEVLYGLDPTKRETTPGIPDSTALNKMKVDQSTNEQGGSSLNGATGDTQNLTQTDKFSQELFSTVASLSQNGTMDQAAVDQITSSLSDHIKNTPPRKIYALTDIKVIQDNSVSAVKKYFDALNIIHVKYPIKGNILDIMQRFMVDANNVDVSILVELNPIITQMQNTLDGIVGTSVPSDLAQVHLDAINAIERLMENLSDIRLYDSDTIVALGGISQYQTNNTLFQSAMQGLMDAINKKLKN